MAEGDLILHMHKGEAAAVTCLHEFDLRSCFWGVVDAWQLLPSGAPPLLAADAHRETDSSGCERERLHDQPFILPAAPVRYFYGPDDFGR